jgi:PAS domain S-box-containing protein
VDVNETVSVQIGYPREKLLTMTIEDFVTSSIWEELSSFFADESQIGRGGRTIGTAFHYDEREIPIEMSIRMVKLNDVVYAVVVARNISKRIKTEKVLRESEERYRRIVDTAAEGIWALGPDGLTTFVNYRMAEMLGYSSEEMLGRPMTDFMLEEDVPDHYRRMENRRNGLSEHYQRRFRRADGSIVWTLVSATPIFDAGHRFSGSFAMFTDNTEQHQASLEIMESRRQVLDILESISDGFYALDNDWRFTYINRKAEQLLGVRRENLLFRNLWQVLSKEEYPRFYDEYHLAKEQMRPVMFEEFVPLFGKWLEMHAYPYKNGMSVYIRDITDRKRMEEALRESEELYRLTLSNITDAVFLTDDAGSFIYICPNVDVIFSYSVSEVHALGNIDFLLGRDLFKPDELEAAQGLINIERKVIDKSGKTHTLLVNVVRVRIKGGTRLYVCRDITERTKAEAALRESEQRYRMVFENSPVSIWEEDFSEVKKLLDNLRYTGVVDIERYFDLHPEIVSQCANLVKIIDVNRAALRLHEAESKDELKTGLAKTFTPESFKTFRDELVLLWNGETEMVSDAVVKTFKGEPRKVEVHYSIPPGYEKTLSRVIVSLVNVTGRRDSE